MVGISMWPKQVVQVFSWYKYYFQPHNFHLTNEQINNNNNNASAIKIINNVVFDQLLIQFKFIQT